ncbi:MAG: FAD-dependent monooxygenase, partial [Clostridia bacterium]|nr:FAD-dependent monooxygenase [Clostridia bacterium]
MIKTDISLPIGYTESDVKRAISEKLPVSADEIKEIRILKRTLQIDSAHKAEYRVSVGASFSEERECGLLKMKKKVSPFPDFSFEIPSSKMRSRPIIVGSGPAGLFAAAVLSEAGARPIVLERGLPVEERIKKVNFFIASGIIDTECNIQFGEGGAGTYSDGKLKVGALDGEKLYILNSFVDAGADAEILYSSSAHLGTDKLSSIISNIRKRLESLGAEFIFGARLCDVKTENGAITSAFYEKGGEKVELPCEKLILASGHSAHDVFEMLSEKGVSMQAKGFGIGVRIEHSREYINELVYGKKYDSRLESASYHLVTHLNNGRSVYSFCMCPGGTVVAAASEEGGVVTNGMSEHARMGENSNAAILVSVSPSDFESDSALAGLKYQRKIEERAFLLAGGDYKAPAATLGSLLGGEKAELSRSVKATYPRGVVAAPMAAALPLEI